MSTLTLYGLYFNLAEVTLILCWNACLSNWGYYITIWIVKMTHIVCPCLLKVLLASWSKSCPIITWSWRETDWRKKASNVKMCGLSLWWWTIRAWCGMSSSQQTAGSNRLLYVERQESLISPAFSFQLLFYFFSILDTLASCYVKLTKPLTVFL